MAVNSPPTGLLLMLSHVLCVIITAFFFVSLTPWKGCKKQSEPTGSIVLVPGENPLADKSAR
jgi:hypothetical protein